MVPLYVWTVLGVTPLFYVLHVDIIKDSKRFFELSLEREPPSSLGVSGSGTCRQNIRARRLIIQLYNRDETSHHWSSASWVRCIFPWFDDAKLDDAVIAVHMHSGFATVLRQKGFTGVTARLSGRGRERDRHPTAVNDNNKITDRPAAAAYAFSPYCPWG